MLPDSENTDEGGVKGGGRSHPASQTGGLPVYKKLTSIFSTLTTLIALIAYQRL